MKAAVLRNQKMVVEDISDLKPQPGQVLVETVACGICGSDLHTVDHAHELASTAAEAGIATFGFNPDHDLVMGHEISVKVLEAVPSSDSSATTLAPGTVAAAMPMLAADGRLAVPGYDNTYPGGYAEQMLLSPEALLPVPNGLSGATAALTEPMAVGLHAVNQSSIEAGRTAIVVGAGPVGLAIIASLSLVGAEPIIASDFSPRRRALAEAMGAHIVLDPGGPDTKGGIGASVEAWATEGAGGSAPPTPPVIFEAVGVPGMIDIAMTGAPAGSEVVVAGVCMENDVFRPIMGIYKHLTVRFVLGWSPEEFATSLHNLAEGRIDVSPMITGHVELADVPQAFADLANPENHVKILVRPNGMG